MGDWAQATGGTEALTTGGGETTLGSAQTAAATYQTKLDINALADASERLTIRVKSKVLTGGTVRQQWSFTVNGANPDKIIVIPPDGTPFHYEVSAQLDAAATGRSIPWAIYKIDSS